ncbi:hypothetical protein C5O19_24445 [Siphonobacter curvatus]|uniref:Uncharacterized protein n=1 Tax=Siphonobacter curvatus TaxID=2094562 RepID=A0A2S7IF74_9BACT|nr:hypothetical protein C5O19_24445 [Siphonobacter curvatus]
MDSRMLPGEARDMNEALRQLPVFNALHRMPTSTKTEDYGNQTRWLFHSESDEPWGIAWKQATYFLLTYIIVTPNIEVVTSLAVTIYINSIRTAVSTKSISLIGWLKISLMRKCRASRATSLTKIVVGANHTNQLV